jgi:hypothetical protein
MLKYSATYSLDRLLLRVLTYYVEVSNQERFRVELSAFLDKPLKFVIFTIFYSFIRFINRVRNTGL